MSRIPQLIDAIGNFNPHYQAGARFPIIDTDANGAPINISLKSWEFRTATGLVKALVADPDNVEGLRLVLTKAEIQALPAVGTDFVIVDVTDDEIRSEGRITPRGWL